MSSQASSHSQACSSRPSCVTEGDNNKMSSAYRMMKQPLTEEPNLLKLSRYRANRNGNNTDPCLTPRLISIIEDQTLSHLT